MSQTEEQQVEDLKRVWEKYGKYAVIALVALVSGLVGGKVWNDYRSGQQEKASLAYEQMMDAMQAGKNDEAMSLGSRLIEGNADSPYAVMAALVVAKLEVDKGDSAAARTRLAWAVDHATIDGVKHIAKLRLAQLLIDANELDQALSQLSVQDAGDYQASYSALKGDVYAKQGKTREARLAYEAALSRTELAPQLRSFVQMKLDDLGGAVSGGPSS